MSERVPKILNVEFYSEYTLKIFFEDNTIKKYNFSELLTKINYMKLKNPSVFRNFQIDKGGYGIVWDDEIDISEYELWKNGTPVQ